MGQAEGLVRRWLGVSLYRNSLFLVLNAVVPALTGLVFWTLAARLYPPEAIGTASAIISAMTLLMFLATFGLEFGLVRFLPEAGANAGRTVMTCFTIAAVTGGGLALLFVAGTGLWATSLAGLRTDPLLGVAFVISVAAFAVYSLAHHVFIAHRRAGNALVQTAFFSTLRFLPLLALAGILTASGIFMAWGGALVAALAISLAFLLPRLHIPGYGVPTLHLPCIRPMLRYSLGNFFANLLWMAPGLLLPLFVITIAGAQANAHFAIGWAVASIIVMVPMGVSLSLFAEGSYDSERLRENASRGAVLMVSLVAAAIVLVWVYGGPMLRVFGPSYPDSTMPLLRLLAIAASPACINYLYVSVARVQKRLRGVIILSAFITAVTLGLSWVLVPDRGIEGVGFAYLIAQTLPFPVTGILLLKILGRGADPEPEYGPFIEGALVSHADHDLHLSRYRFARTYARGKDCLDIGCGTGYGSAHLAGGGADRVTGGDISDEAIAIATQHQGDNGNLSFRKLDATALPYPDESFGLVTAFEVIEHVADGERLLSEANRVLKKGGTLVLSTPNRHAGPLFFRTSWDNHVHEYTVRELSALVNRQFGACQAWGQDFIVWPELMVRRLRQTAGRTLEKIGLRPLAQWLGKSLFKHNRLVVFHAADFNAPENGGRVQPCRDDVTPTTIVILARKNA